MATCFFLCQRSACGDFVVSEFVTSVGSLAPRPLWCSRQIAVLLILAKKHRPPFWCLHRFYIGAATI